MAVEPIPAEFEAALKAAGLWDFFQGCTRAHQREYLKWISEAKKAETRVARSHQAAKMLEAKRKQEAAD